MRLLLDENISSRIAEQLRAQGHDAIAVTEAHDLRGQPDATVLEWAVERGRAIASYDTGFASLLQQRIAAEMPVVDVILISKRRFPGSDRGVGALVRALTLLLETAVPGVGGRLLWLSEAEA